MGAKKKSKTESADPRTVLEGVLQDLRRQDPDFRGGFGSEEHVEETLKIRFFPTPIASLNSAMGGGVPGARWTTMFGPEKSGKTTMCGQIIAIDMENNPKGYWAWFDAEDTFDKNYMAMLGVNLNHLIFVPPGGVMEDEQDKLMTLASSGALRGFVVDSVGAYVSGQEMFEKKTGLLKSMRDDTVVSVPRKLSEFLRRATPMFSRHKMAQILIGHIYQGINARNPAASGMVQKGGNALKHWAGMRLVFRRATDEEFKRNVMQPDGQIKLCQVGFRSIIRIDKTKVSPTEGMEVEIPFFYGTGFDSAEATIRSAIAMNIIEQRGAWFKHPKFPGEKNQLQGRDAVKQYVKENTELLDQLSSDILAVVARTFGLQHATQQEEPTLE